MIENYASEFDCGAKPITAEGGQAAHLAQVALERGIPMMRVVGAMARFPVGTMVSLYPAEGRVHIWLRHD